LGTYAPFGILIRSSVDPFGCAVAALRRSLPRIFKVARSPTGTLRVSDYGRVIRIRAVRSRATYRAKRD
jgi:hypothetical protein